MTPAGHYLLCWAGHFPPLRNPKTGPIRPRADRPSSIVREAPSKEILLCCSLGPEIRNSPTTQDPPPGTITAFLGLSPAATRWSPVNLSPTRWLGKELDLTCSPAEEALISSSLIRVPVNASSGPIQAGPIFPASLRRTPPKGGPSRATDTRTGSTGLG